MLSNDTLEPTKRGWIPCLAAVILALAFVAFRSPDLLRSPHFWAEGGAHYNAAMRGGGLFFVHVQAGYFNLVANIGGVLGALLPMRWAPFGPTYLAWFVHGIPFLMLMLTRADWLRSPYRKALIFACMLFLPTLSSATWMNTINSQLYIGLACLLILLDEDQRAGASKRWMQRLSLALGGLSGVYSASLAPLFWIRSRGKDCAEKRIHWKILTIALTIQLLLAGGTRLASLQNTRRTQPYTSEALADISTVHVGKALLGDKAISIARNNRPIGPYMFGVLFGIFALNIARKSIHRKGWAQDPRALIFGALIIWTTLVVVSSFGHRPIGRYAVLPSMAVALFLASSLDFKKHPIGSAPLLGLLVFGLWQGAKDYRDELPCIAAHDGQWAREVSIHRASPEKSLSICPTGWSVQLFQN